MSETRDRKLRFSLVAVVLLLLGLFLLFSRRAAPPSPERAPAPQAQRADSNPDNAVARALTAAASQHLVAAPDAAASLSGLLISARTQQPVAPGNLLVTPLDESQMSFDNTAPPPGQQLLAVDSNGRFAIKQLKAGRYFIEATSPGFAHETRIVRAPSKTPLVIVMRDAAFISGKVVHEDKSPAAGALVLAVSASDELNAVAGESGGFSFEVAPGMHTLFARSGGFSARLDAPIEVKPGQTIDNVVLILKSGASLSGQVRNDAGEAIVGARVSLSLVAATRSAALLTEQTDRDGHYEFPHLTPGLYSVAAKATGFANGDLKRVVIASAPSKLDLVLHGAAALEGRVLDHEGLGIAGALVTLTDYPWTAADGNGHFLLDGLAPGKTVLSARRAGQAMGAVKEVLLVANTTVHEDITLGNMATLHGVVRYRSGGALDGQARVSAWHIDTSGGTETDDKGAYSMTVEEGDYKVSARPVGWVGGFAIASGVAITLAAGEDRELDLNLAQDGPDDGIHGLVLEPGGAPSIRPLISAVIEGQGQRNFSAREDGTFDLPMPQLNGNPIALYASNGGREGTGRADDQATHPIIQLLPAATLAGEVQRADNQTVQTFTLTITHIDNVMAYFIDRPVELSGANFVLDGVAPGAIHLVATAPDGSTGEVDLNAQPGELAQARITLGPASAQASPQRDPRRRL